MRISDCSSDVCSSDLLRLPHSRIGAENQGFSGLLGGDAQEPEVGEGNDEVGAYHQDAVGRDRLPGLRLLQGLGHDGNRGPAAGGAPVEAGRRLVSSAERRVGNGCATSSRSRWSPLNEKKKNTK